MKVIIKPIVNNLFQANISYKEFSATGIGKTEDESIASAVAWLKRELHEVAKPKNCFVIANTSSLKTYKLPIRSTGGLAVHYYLSESPGLKDSVGWGAKGLELKGKVRVTKEQAERINRFVEASRYNIATNNCEHFANYVSYGLNFSSQQQIWWKELSANFISNLQHTNSVNDNMLKAIADRLNENLNREKVKEAIEQLDRFCTSKGI